MVHEGGTFKSRTGLEKLYRNHGITPEKEIVTYCRIGERSSHTWFVLKHLVGYARVRNYDGSWAEWGNQIRSPIERPQPWATCTGADGKAFPGSQFR